MKHSLLFLIGILLISFCKSSYKIDSYKNKPKKQPYKKGGYQQKKAYPKLFFYKKNNNCSTNSCTNDFKGTNALYNHFIIDDRVQPGYNWNEIFTSGI